MTTETFPAADRIASPVAMESPRPTICLSAVSWEDCLALQELFDRHRGYRLAYDRGALEILSPTLSHDDDSQFLGDLVRVATMTLELPARRGGSTTIRKELLEKGVEPDDCFWIESAPLMAGRREFDVDADPPLDLAIEVDVTHTSLNRFTLYAAFRVREIWRLTGDSLMFHALDSAGKYQPTDCSVNFPSIRSSELVRFVMAARDAPNQNAVLHEFQAWLSGVDHRQDTP